jgi:hypothetical protein
VKVVSKVIRLNTSISDGNRFVFQIYPLCVFLMTNILRDVIVQIVHCISVRCWIAVNEMFVLLSTTKKGVITSAAQEIRTAKAINSD